MAISDNEIFSILGQTGSSFLPSGAIAETVARRKCNSSQAISSGFLYMSAITLAVNNVIASITVVSNSTGFGGTHTWYALYDNNLNLLRQTQDFIGAVGASTTLTLFFSTPFTTTYTGLYYVGFMSQGGTTGICASSSNATLNQIAPILAGTSTNALVAIAPNPAAAITPSAVSIYAFVSGIGGWFDNSAQL